jgi:hypothetical protein
MLVYALEDLKAGDEVTTSYFLSLCPLKERELTAKRWGFKCNCRLCEMDRSDLDGEREREQLLTQCKEIEE